MSVPSDPLCGQMIDGRYLIDEPIAQGGFARVYRARHRYTNARVAVKILCRLDEQAQQRFKQEAQTAAALQHPAIVRVFDMGSLADGRPYLVMEHLTGQTLRQRLGRSRRLTLSEALRITTQLGAGLAEIHKRNIIHRDLKPENIFLVRHQDDSQRAEQALLLDFGLARVHDGLRLTQDTDECVVLGTAAYLSPEAVSGHPAAVDARSDQFSLAIILYEMLTGAPPFTGRDRKEVCDRIMGIGAEPAPLRELVSDVPPHVAAAVMRALEKVKDQRFSSVLDLISALQPGPTGRRVPGPVNRGARGCAWSFAAYLTTFVLGGVAAATWRGPAYHATLPAVPTDVAVSADAAVPAASSAPIRNAAARSLQPTPAPTQPSTLIPATGLRSLPRVKNVKAPPTEIERLLQKLENAD